MQGACLCERAGVFGPANCDTELNWPCVCSSGGLVPQHIAGPFRGLRKHTRTLSAGTTVGNTHNAAAGARGGSTTATAAGGVSEDDDEKREAAYRRLEGLGYRVGLGMAERCVHTNQKPTQTFLDGGKSTDI